MLGPHDPESRSPVGSFFWWLVNSDAWEMIFLMYILFNAALKLTDLRIQVCVLIVFRLSWLNGLEVPIVQMQRCYKPNAIARWPMGLHDPERPQLWAAAGMG